MKHTSRRIIAGLLAASLFSPMAVADTAAPSPVGAWSFMSAKMRNGCTLAGHMNVTRAKGGALSCVFTARWACEQPFRMLTDTEQTCTAKQSGADIAITSKMKAVNRVEPQDLFAELSKTYAADHFKLKLSAAADEMRGVFHSYGQAEVVFRRRVERIG
jgi:hypothetical protein